MKFSRLCNVRYTFSFFVSFNVPSALPSKSALFKKDFRKVSYNNAYFVRNTSKYKGFVCNDSEVGFLVRVHSARNMPQFSGCYLKLITALYTITEAIPSCKTKLVGKPVLQTEQSKRDDSHESANTK